MRTPQLKVSIPDKDRELLQMMAKAEHLSEAAFIRRAIRREYKALAQSKPDAAQPRPTPPASAMAAGIAPAPPAPAMLATPPAAPPAMAMGAPAAAPARRDPKRDFYGGDEEGKSKANYDDLPEEGILGTLKKIIWG